MSGLAIDESVNVADSTIHENRLGWVPVLVGPPFERGVRNLCRRQRRRPDRPERIYYRWFRRGRAMVRHRTTLVQFPAISNVVNEIYSVQAFWRELTRTPTGIILRNYDEFDERNASTPPIKQKEVVGARSSGSLFIIQQEL